MQGSHYFQIRGRSDFSFRELTGRSERQQREVGRLLGEVNCDKCRYFLNNNCRNLFVLSIMVKGIQQYLPAKPTKFGIKKWE
jgi:hypothetical protein